MFILPVITVGWQGFRNVGFAVGAHGANTLRSITVLALGLHGSAGVGSWPILQAGAFRRLAGVMTGMAANEAVAAPSRTHANVQPSTVNRVIAMARTNCSAPPAARDRPQPTGTSLSSSRRRSSSRPPAPGRRRSSGCCC